MVDNILEGHLCLIVSEFSISRSSYYPLLVNNLSNIADRHSGSVVVKAVGGSSESSTSLDIIKSVRNVVST